MSQPHEPALRDRVRDGLGLLTSLARHDGWTAAGTDGVMPTQRQVLDYLHKKAPSGCRIKELAAHLLLSQPTVTDCVSALERKGLVARQRDASDGRATVVALTDSGRLSASALPLAASLMAVALESLSADEQAILLKLIIKMIRQMQVAGAVPAQRMCVSCRHFQPHAHQAPSPPHHCKFVNAAFGDRDLRLDCRDHEAANPAAESANWAIFDAGEAPLQANP